MARYLITSLHKTVLVEADEKGGILVEPNTHVPLVNQRKYDALHEVERAKLDPLIRHAREAAQAKKTLIQEARTDDAAAQKNGTISHAERLKRRSEGRARFGASTIYTRNTPDDFSRDSSRIRILKQKLEEMELTIPAPSPGLIVEKFYKEDYNFTPQETALLLKNSRRLMKCALSTRHEEIVSMLVGMVETKKPTGSMDSKAGKKIFRELCAHGKTEHVQSIMEKLPVNRRRDILVEDAFSALHLAVAGGHNTLLQYLLQQNDLLTEGAHQKKSPLVGKDEWNRLYKTAVKNGHAETAAILAPRAGKHVKKQFPLSKLDPATSEPSTPGPKQAVKPFGSMHPAFNPEVYTALLPLVRMACILEGTENMLDAPSRAYTLAVLFPSAESALNYIKDTTAKYFAKMPHPFASATDIHLPYDHGWDVHAWRKFLRRDGAQITKFLPEAAKIEKEFALKYPGWAFDKCEIDRLHMLAPLTAYNYHAFSHPELADIFKRYHKSEDALTRAIKLLEEREKQITKNGGIERDNIPDVGIIDGKDVGHPEFYLIKLHKDDPRAMIFSSLLGNNCSSIDGGGKQIVRGQVLSPEVGVYAVLSKNEGQINPLADTIQAKMTALRTTDGNLLFNAWERNDVARNCCVGFFREAARRAMLSDDAIKKVQMGKTHSGWRPYEWADFPKVDNKEHIQAIDERHRSRDATNVQYLVLDRNQLKNLPRSKATDLWVDELKRKAAVSSGKNRG